MVIGGGSGLGVCVSLDILRQCWGSQAQAVLVGGVCVGSPLTIRGCWGSQAEVASVGGVTIGGGSGEGGFRRCVCVS